jgi:septum formation protein
MTGSEKASSTEKIVLASASRTRRAMLEAAGIVFETVPANIDEDKIKRAMGTDRASPAEIATALAEQKARRISAEFPEALVIGSDQVLVLDNDIMSKPENRDAAFDQLCRLRGRDHSLISAACILRDGVRIWQAADAAHLRMRDFTDSFAGNYLDQVGDIALEGPGAYRIEGLGAQLFARIDGSHFTILGLPLLPLLEYLRDRGVLEH